LNKKTILYKEFKKENTKTDSVNLDRNKLTLSLNKCIIINISLNDKQKFIEKFQLTQKTSLGGTHLEQT